MKDVTRFEKLIWATVLLLLLGIRLIQLFGPLDEPSWRQVWCAYQTQRLALEWPMQLLHTKINLRGTNDVSFWNFPIYEATVALLYKLAGGVERLWVARLVTLLFFAGIAFFLYRATARIIGESVAVYTLIFYCLLPVGIFFSRAVHYDIAVLFFCHWYFWQMLTFFETGSKRAYVLAVLALTSAFSMKPPYGFYWVLPAMIAGAWGRDFRGWKRVFVWTSATLILPVLVAAWLHGHRLGIESQHPPSILYPEPYTALYAKDWYFGGLDVRTDLQRWRTFLREALNLVFTPVGGVLCALALLAPASSIPRKGWVIWCSLVCGTAGYVLLVFPMVASAHSYYLLPLLAPAALGAALGLQALVECEKRDWIRIIRLLVITAAMALLSWRALRERGFFDRDWHRISAGEIVQRETSPDALIVTTAKGRSTGSTDPRALYFMNRRGWSIRLDSLGPEEIETFRKAGASFVALLVWNGYPTDPSAYFPLSSFPARVWSFKDPEQRDCGSLILYDLRADSSKGPPAE